MADKGKTHAAVIYVRTSMDFGKKNDSMRKRISIGAEWSKFQLRSTFHFGVKGPQKMTSILVKTPYYSPWFLARI